MKLNIVYSGDMLPGTVYCTIGREQQPADGYYEIPTAPMVVCIENNQLFRNYIIIITIKENRKYVYRDNSCVRKTTLR